MRDSLEEESKDKRFKNQSLLAIEETDKYDFLARVAKTESKDERNTYQTEETIHALMTRTCFDEDEEEEKQPEVSFLETKSKINMYSKKQLQSLSSVLIDACYLVKSKNNQLMDEYICIP
ncbi:hypothetical protein H5410_050455 [Solanum commersonii]|uniref:Uncharacterized protein n=1 Tax=Solanum commersonii TaxID=4109 RepID=A0A9J5WXM8_SOLCO|nr:hypothetical protein H5410_050455 [Solanum commersonii]